MAEGWKTIKLSDIRITDSFGTLPFFFMELLVIDEKLKQI